MNEYEEMLKNADRRYHYSELEKQKISDLLGYCHATDVRKTHKGLYGVFYECEAISGKELTTDFCSSACARYYGCSNCAVVDDVECLINQEKTVLDLEPSDEFYFKDEVKSILKRYHGDKKEALHESEIELIVDEFRKELRCFNSCLGK